MIIIVGMLVTQLYIMRITVRNKLNTWEIIFLRIGVAIYTGWVTAATILNVSFVLQAFGMSDPNAGFTEA